MTGSQLAARGGYGPGGPATGSHPAGGAGYGPAGPVTGSQLAARGGFGSAGSPSGSYPAGGLGSAGPSTGGYPAGTGPVTGSHPAAGSEAGFGQLAPPTGAPAAGGGPAYSGPVSGTHPRAASSRAGGDPGSDAGLLPLSPAGAGFGPVTGSHRSQDPDTGGSGPATGSVAGISAAYPLRPAEDGTSPPTELSRRPLRSVPGGGADSGPGGRGPAPGWARRGAGPLPTGGAAAAAAALPEPYDTAARLAAYDAPPPAFPTVDSYLAARDASLGVGEDEPDEPRRRGRPGRADSPVVGSAALLPPPGARVGPAGPAALRGPVDLTGQRPAMRAVPAPDDRQPADWVIEGGPPADRWAEEGPAFEPADDGGRRRGRRRSGAGGQSGRAAALPEEDLDVPSAPPGLGGRAARVGAPALRAVAEPADEPDSGIPYGFEEEDADGGSSLLVQWTVFILQTIVGALAGLGTWLGFHQLWERWPFYAAAAVGVAISLMVVVAKLLRRRYGHDLDLLTALLAVAIGVVLTVLPAAFSLQSL